jgi:hypothetical protein
LGWGLTWFGLLSLDCGLFLGWGLFLNDRLSLFGGTDADSLSLRGPLSGHLGGRLSDYSGWRATWGTTWGTTWVITRVGGLLGYHLGWRIHSGGATTWVDALLVELSSEPRGLMLTTRVGGSPGLGRLLGELLGLGDQFGNHLGHYSDWDPLHGLVLTIQLGADYPAWC